MAIRVLDRYVEDQLIAERRRTGADRYDEVWDGEYVVSPLANLEHQDLAGALVAIFRQIVGFGPDVFCQPGANVSDQEVHWTKNFRCPDVVVALPGCRAQRRDTHWYGGPDLVVEIVSEGDASYEKLAFYEQIGVREVLIVDRDPWQLELHRLHDDGTLALAGRVALDSSEPVTSHVLDADLSLITSGERPTIRVVHRPTGQKWEA
jgi:Uma2 family endonuclease